MILDDFYNAFSFNVKPEPFNNNIIITLIITLNVQKTGSGTEDRGDFTSNSTPHSDGGGPTCATTCQEVALSSLGWMPKFHLLCRT